MNLDELSNRIIDQLYSGLTGGSAELPLPKNIMLNWIQPGIPFDASAFDWAISGPYAGPSSLTLDFFRQLVETIQGKEGAGMSREMAVEEAKRMYQQQLLGGWEQWSRLVDFVPLAGPQQSQTTWKMDGGRGKYKHVSVVYAQAGQQLSKVYQDTLQRCEVAAEELTEEQKTLVKRMEALLQEAVEVEDFLTGEKKIEYRDSRVMLAYNQKKAAYDNAVTDYAARLARANNGTAADLIEWTRSGGVYKQRANAALRDWIATGYKKEVERAQATISQITGTSMVSYVEKLRLDVEDIENNVQGSYGYPFFPAGLIPGGFARSPGWSRMEEYHLDQKVKVSSSSRNWGGTGGLNLGFFSIGASAGGSHKKEDFQFTREEFGIAFDYTQVEIMRPAFNPNFFLSRGWRPKDSFINDYGPLHSDGKEVPSGALIGYPTKALFVRDLTIRSTDLARELHSRQDQISAGAVLGIGPFCVGGHYAQSDKQAESNLQIDGANITIKGLQLVAFLSAFFPLCANPSPDVKAWI